MDRIRQTFDRARDRLAAVDDAIVRSQVEITQIASPTGAEQARGAWVAERFKALGLANVRSDDAGNIIGLRRGHAASSVPPGPARGTTSRLTQDASPGSPPSRVVVLAHLDTVFPADTDLTVRREGDRFVGPGIGDNARGLAALLAVAAELAGDRYPVGRDVEYVATTGEEGSGDLRGAKHYFGTATPGSIAAAISLDGPGDDRIIHRALGARRYRVTFLGPGGHSWAAFGAPNAVHAAGHAVAKLAALPLPSAPRSTLSVTRIGGGLSVNTIPGEAWFELDVRSTGGEALARLDREVRRVVDAAVASANDGRTRDAAALTARIDVIGDRPCGEVAGEHPLVRAAVAATHLVGREPECTAASTDANVPIALGIPAITLGAGGRGGDEHTVHEWFENTEGPRGIARALAVIVEASA